MDPLRRLVELARAVGRQRPVERRVDPALARLRTREALRAVASASRSVQTKPLTGLPGRPKTNLPAPSVANTNGLPGLMRSFVIFSSTPSSRSMRGT